MQPFDLEQLRSLVAAVEAGSLSAAAPKLYRSQSAVSEQIRKLEDFAGIVLLHRGKAGIRPTPAGERLLVHARELLAASDRALEDMRGMGLAGDLRLAITDYFRPGTIAQILRRLRTRYPKLRLHVSISKSIEIEQAAQSGRIDIGLFMRILDERPSPEGVPVRREALTWVAGREFDDDPRGPLPLVALPADCSLQRFVRQLLEAHNVPYVIAHSASGIAGLQSALVAGLGVSCLNASAIPQEAGRLARPLPPLPEIEFRLLPPCAGEASIVGEVRTMLAAAFA